MATRRDEFQSVSGRQIVRESRPDGFPDTTRSGARDRGGHRHAMPQSVCEQGATELFDRLHIRSYLARVRTDLRLRKDNSEAHAREC